jgi:hypothetical protein
MVTTQNKPAASGKVEVESELKLRWPEGWKRTLIELRKGQKRWGKTASYYRQSVVRELTLMGATAVLITHWPGDKERMDPGVAVWFSLVKEDYSWQTLLDLPPAPTLDEIDHAFRSKAKPIHPDRTDGGDPEMFKRMGDAKRRARDWVMGENKARYEYVMALDLYTTIHSNLAGLAQAFKALRSLERLGMPTILERVMEGALKGILPMTASGGTNEPRTERTA